MNLLLHKYLFLITISQPPLLPPFCRAVININHKKHKSVQILKNETRAKTDFVLSCPSLKTKKNKTVNKNNTKKQNKTKKNKRLLYPVWHLSQQETLSGQVPVR